MPNCKTDTLQTHGRRDRGKTCIRLPQGHCQVAQGVRKPKTIQAIPPADGLNSDVVVVEALLADAPEAAASHIASGCALPCPTRGTPFLLFTKFLGMLLQPFPHEFRVQFIAPSHGASSAFGST